MHIISLSVSLTTSLYHLQIIPQDLEENSEFKMTDKISLRSDGSTLKKLKSMNHKKVIFNDFLVKLYKKLFEKSFIGVHIFKCGLF